MSTRQVSEWKKGSPSKGSYLPTTTSLRMFQKTAIGLALVSFGRIAFWIYKAQDILEFSPHNHILFFFLKLGIYAYLPRFFSNIPKLKKIQSTTIISFSEFFPMPTGRQRQTNLLVLASPRCLEIFACSFVAKVRIGSILSTMLLLF
jgi:hypothetical protein